MFNIKVSAKFTIKINGCDIKAALTIRGFGIHGYDYSRP